MTTLLLHGDALQIPLRDESVDLIITDPPYHRMKNEAWDRQWKTDADYLDWIRSLCAEFNRVLKRNGSLYLFASPEMAGRVECVVREQFNVLNVIRWEKEEGWHQKAKKDELRCFLSPWEAIIFAEPWESDDTAEEEAGYTRQCDKLHKKVYAPIGRYIQQERERAGFSQNDTDVALGYVEKNNPLKGSRLIQRWEEGSSLPTKEAYERLRDFLNTRGGEFLCKEYEDLRKEYEDLRKEYEDLRRPFFLTAKIPYTDVWRFKTVSASPWKHSCEKPLSLLSHIVQCSSRPGTLVLDACMGSGATGVAAITLGRSFVGIEKDPLWVKRAKFWINATESQGQLFAAAS